MLRVGSKEFEEALGLMQYVLKGVGKSVKLEVQGNQLFVKGMGNGMGLEVSVWVEEAEPFQCVVNGEKLYQAVKLSKSPRVTAQIRDSRLVLEDNLGFFELAVLEEDIPEVPPPTERLFGIEKLPKLIERVLFAVSREKIPPLGCLLLEVKEGRLNVVGSDGHRLAKLSQEIEGIDVSMEKRFLLSRESAGLIAKIFNGEALDVYVGYQILFFEGVGKRFWTQLVEASYPNYELFVPTGFARKAKMFAKDLLSAVEKGNIFKTKEFGFCSLVFSFEPKGLFSSERDYVEVRSFETDLGEARFRIECEYSGEPLRLTLNADYVKEALERIEAPEVTLLMNSEKEVVRIAGFETDIFYLVMPMIL